MKMKRSNSRRSFLKKMAKGVALTSVALSSAPSFGVSTTNASEKDENAVSQKPVRIGVIGAENSHTIGYGRLFNIEKKFPGVEVVYVWGETDEFARAASEKGKIPNIVKDPREMLGKIDALIVDHRHPKYHLEPAIPFIRAKIPTFIDKPFCYRVSEGKDFLALARSTGTPVSSWSTSAHTDKVMDIKKNAGSLGQINNIVGFGPVDIESQWGGVFFYGVHFTDKLLYIFGDNVSKVRVTKNGRTATGSLLFNNGMLATIAFLTQARDSTFYAETKKGMVELKSDVEETDPPRCYVDMVNMFRTGKEPRTHQSILYSMAVLEALERSVNSDNWENVVV
jgi:predicted dehydrogenase